MPFLQRVTIGGAAEPPGAAALRLYEGALASLLAPQDPRFLTAEEFPQIDVGAELRAGLDAGGSRMKAGGSREPARAQDEIFPAPGVRPRGGGCRAQGPGMAVATYDRSVRYPDVTVEALSPGTREHDLRVIKED